MVTFQSVKGAAKIYLRAKDIYQTVPGKPEPVVTCIKSLYRSFKTTFVAKKKKKKTESYLEQMVLCKQMTWRKQNCLTLIFILSYLSGEMILTLERIE